MSDDGVIDLDEARARKERGELPSAIHVGPIIRSRPGMVPLCAHREMELDSSARVVRCSTCSADLDPFEVLDTVAAEWDRLEWAVKSREVLDEQMDLLRDEERRLKARLRTARRAQPPEAGELAKLRALEEVLRKTVLGQCSSRVLAVLAALDELRAEAVEADVGGAP